MGDRMVFLQLQIHAMLEVPTERAPEGATLKDAWEHCADLKLSGVFQEDVRVVCHSAEIVGITLAPGHAQNASDAVVGD